MKLFILHLALFLGLALSVLEEMLVRWLPSTILVILWQETFFRQNMWKPKLMGVANEAQVQVTVYFNLAFNMAVIVNGLIFKLDIFIFHS